MGYAGILYKKGWYGLSNLDKAIKEVREYREWQEEQEKQLNINLEAERDAIILYFEKWLLSGQVNGIMTIGDRMNLASAFAVGWYGAKEYIFNRK